MGNQRGTTTTTVKPTERYLNGTMATTTTSHVKRGSINGTSRPGTGRVPIGVLGQSNPHVELGVPQVVPLLLEDHQQYRNSGSGA
jgi:hypothetical protein